MAEDGTTQTMTLDEVRNRATLRVEEAGQLLGVGRSGAYAAAARGDFPTIRVGRSVRVPVAPLLRMLGVDDDRAASA